MVIQDSRQSMSKKKLYDTKSPKYSIYRQKGFDLKTSMILQSSPLKTTTKKKRSGKLSMSGTENMLLKN